MQHSNMWRYFVRMLYFFSEKGDKSLFKSTYRVCYSVMATGTIS